jgi:carbon-monoxide dehydrogenase medium subunit
LTALSEDELLTQIRVPVAKRSAYRKLPSPASHYALVGVAAAVEGNGTISAARIGVTGAAPVAFRANRAEEALLGTSLTTESIQKAARRAYDGRGLLEDIHASNDYRAAMLETMTARALQGILGQAIQ